jgi:hypothetical protein
MILAKDEQLRLDLALEYSKVAGSPSSEISPALQLNSSGGKIQKPRKA